MWDKYSIESQSDMLKFLVFYIDILNLLFIVSVQLIQTYIANIVMSRFIMKYFYMINNLQVLLIIRSFNSFI